MKEGFYIRLDYQINSLRDRSLITGEGELVEKGGGSGIFVDEKKGGSKNFCAL